MKKLIVYCLLLIVNCLVLFAPPSASADETCLADGRYCAGTTECRYNFDPNTGTPVSSYCVCPGGLTCQNPATPFDGYIGQLVCGTNIRDWNCTSTGWIESPSSVMCGSCPGGGTGCSSDAQCPSGQRCNINPGDSTGSCVISGGGGSGTCSDLADNPSGTSLPGQQTDFTNLMSQIGTRSTCTDSVIPGGVIDYCITSTQLEEEYCVVNAAFPSGRCFQTQSSCPAGTTCDSSRGACVPSGGGGTGCSSDAQCPSGQRCNINPVDGTGTCVISGGGSPGGGTGPGGLPGVGTITRPIGFNLPFISGDTNVFVAGLVRNGIGAMILIAFVVALIWLILAGFKFILANGEPKEVSAAWSQIRYALIGLAIIMSTYAIIKMVETFFGVNIIGGGLRLPTRTS